MIQSLAVRIACSGQLLLHIIECLRYGMPWSTPDPLAIS